MPQLPSRKPYKECIISFLHNIWSRNFYSIFPLGSFIKNLYFSFWCHTRSRNLILSSLSEVSYRISIFLPAPHTVKDFSFIFPRKFHKESLFSFRYYIRSRILFYLPSGSFLKNLYFPSGTTYGQGF